MDVRQIDLGSGRNPERVREGDVGPRTIKGRGDENETPAAKKGGPAGLGTARKKGSGASSCDPRVVLDAVYETS